MAATSSGPRSVQLQGQYSPRSSHSRSASWSYTSGDGQITLSSHLEPITSVIRELVPGFGRSSSYTENEHHNVHHGTARSDSVYVDLSAVDLADGDTRGQTNAFSRHHSGENISASASEFDTNTNDGSTSINQGSGNNGNNGRSNGDRMEFQGAIKWIENSVPFLLLLLSRIMWDHRLGILVGIGLTGTFLHANNTIKRQVALKEMTSKQGHVKTLHSDSAVKYNESLGIERILSKQDKRLNRISLWTILFLCGNVCFIYYVFHNQQLQHCLTFQRPNFSKLDVWVVFWCVVITDYVIRMVTMAFKSLVVIVHRKIIPFKYKGKYYLLLENISQFYRILTPIPLWYTYFTNYNFGGEYFAIFSTAFYFLLKARIIRTKCKDLYAAMKTFQHDVQYGSPASREQINKLGNTCPICQEEFCQPISLHNCTHTFCEDCISLWFDREQTCPLCRAKVVGDPSWRDGSTSVYLQLF